MGETDRRFQHRSAAGATITTGLSLLTNLTILVALNEVTPVGVAAAAVGLLVVVCAALSILLRRPPLITPADAVTLARSVLIGACTTVIILSLVGVLPTRSWLLVALAVPALLLDAVDGWVARRTGTASPAGARLDMEVDSVFLIILSVPAAIAFGPWVLAIGAMRYLFLVASWWRPALSQRLSYSSFRRCVAGLQGGVLAGALAPIVPWQLAVGALAVALLLLLISFGKDIMSLERSHRRRWRIR